jgi:hypothetical protein
MNMSGRRAMDKTFRYAMLSKASVALVSINNQSNDKNTPDELPTCLAEDMKSSTYVGNCKL